MSKSAMPSVGVLLAGAVFAAVWTLHLTFGLQLVIWPLGLGSFSLFDLAPKTVAVACFAALWTASCLGPRRWAPARSRAWWITTLGGLAVLLAAGYFPVAEIDAVSAEGIGIVGGPDGPTSIIVRNRFAPRSGFSWVGSSLYFTLLLGVFGGAAWADARAARGVLVGSTSTFSVLAGFRHLGISGWALPAVLGLISTVCCAVLALAGRIQNGTQEVLSAGVYTTSSVSAPTPSRPFRPTEMNRSFDGIQEGQLLWFGSEWGFVGFVDPDAYASSANEANGEAERRWTPETLLRRAQGIMNREEGFFWGSAEAELSYRLNPADFDALKSKARAVYSGFFSSSKGRICLMTEQSMAFVAQFPGEYQIPVREDVVWRVEPGRYSIEVLQLFRYDASEQCPGDCDPDFDPEAVHYVIRILPADERAERVSYSQIPNQPAYYRLAK